MCCVHILNNLNSSKEWDLKSVETDLESVIVKQGWSFGLKKENLGLRLVSIKK